MIKIYFIEPYYILYWNPESGKIRINSNSPHKSGLEITIRINDAGYLCAKINSKHLIIHQFIGEKLFGEKKRGYTVNHKDGNKLNNSKDNLEYITISENVKHAYQNGLHVASNPERNGNYKDGRSVKSRIKEYKKEWYERNRKKN